mmetsp:Transcript_53931/g.157379  ORF Transcript_53931/g.157379 Transcript_53931/m.157379 type:complete len:460 (+) Transcript_53931:682-2061(+)
MHSGYLWKPQPHLLHLCRGVVDEDEGLQAEVQLCRKLLQVRALVLPVDGPGGDVLRLQPHVQSPLVEDAADVCLVVLAGEADEPASGLELHESVLQRHVHARHAKLGHTVLAHDPSPEGVVAVDHEDLGLLVRAAPHDAPHHARRHCHHVGVRVWQVPQVAAHARRQRIVAHRVQGVDRGGRHIAHAPPAWELGQLLTDAARNCRHVRGAEVLGRGFALADHQLPLALGLGKLLHRSDEVFRGPLQSLQSPRSFRLTSLGQPVLQPEQDDLCAIGGHARKVAAGLEQLRKDRAVLCQGHLDGCSQRLAPQLERPAHGVRRERGRDAHARASSPRGGRCHRAVVGSGSDGLLSAARNVPVMERQQGGRCSLLLAEPGHQARESLHQGLQEWREQPHSESGKENAPTVVWSNRPQQSRGIHAHEQQDHATDDRSKRRRVKPTERKLILVLLLALREKRGVL